MPASLEHVPNGFKTLVRYSIMLLVIRSNADHFWSVFSHSLALNRRSISTSHNPPRSILPLHVAKKGSAFESDFHLASFPVSSQYAKKTKHLTGIKYTFGASEGENVSETEFK